LRQVALILNGTMLVQLGGTEKFLGMLLTLQKLCMTEENLVREVAVDSIISCAKEMESQDVEQNVLPLVTFLSRHK